MEIQYGAVALFVGGQVSIIVVEWFRSWNGARVDRREAESQRRFETIYAFQESLSGASVAVNAYLNMRARWATDHPDQRLDANLQERYSLPLIQQLLQLRQKTIATRSVEIGKASDRFNAAISELMSAGPMLLAEIDQLHVRIEQATAQMLLGAESETVRIERRPSTREQEAADRAFFAASSRVREGLFGNLDLEEEPYAR